MQINLHSEVSTETKPFLKWAGGKGQLWKNLKKKAPSRSC